MAAVRRNVFLVTDFGTEDCYAGQIRAVLARATPDANVVDLTHGIQPYAVREAAWTIEISLPYLPPQSIVLGVVDPGVGGQRRPVAVQGPGGELFVGPDNGLFAGILPDWKRLAGPVGLEGAGARLWVLDPSLLGLDPQRISPTFEGRDIFAPAAAALARDVPCDQLGRESNSMESLPRFLAVPSDRGLHGEVIHIDRFGNVITTVRAEQVAGRDRFRLAVGNRHVELGTRTFETIPGGALAWHIDSSGFVAIAANRARAADELQVSQGDAVEVIWDR